MTYPVFIAFEMPVKHCGIGLYALRMSGLHNAEPALAAQLLRTELAPYGAVEYLGPAAGHGAQTAIFKGP